MQPLGFPCHARPPRGSPPRAAAGDAHRGRRRPRLVDRAPAGRRPPGLRGARPDGGDPRRPLRGALALARAHARRDRRRGARHRRRGAPRRLDLGDPRLLVAGLAIGLFLRTGPELNTQIAISALLCSSSRPGRRHLRRRAHLGDGRRLRHLARSSRPSSCHPIRCATRGAGSARRPRALAADLAAAQGTLTRGEPSPRVLLAHADEHARADRPRRRGLSRRRSARCAGARCGAAPARSSPSSTGASGSRCGWRSRCAAWRATSRASRTATICATSGTRRRAG